MRRRFRLLLFLVIVFSFLIGFPEHTLDLEVVSVSKVLYSAGSVLDAIKISLLIAVHLALISLLFRNQDAPAYKRYLLFIPVVFFLIHALNAFVIYKTEPRVMLTALPFFVAYLLCMYQYHLLLTKEQNRPTIK